MTVSKVTSVGHLTIAFPTLYGSDASRAITQRAAIGAAAVALGLGALSISALEAGRSPGSFELYRPLAEVVSADAPAVDAVGDFELSGPFGTFTVPETAPGEVVLPEGGAPTAADTVNAASSGSGDAVLFDAGGETAAPAPAADPAPEPQAPHAEGRVANPLSPVTEVADAAPVPTGSTTGSTVPVVDEVLDAVDAPPVG